MILSLGRGLRDCGQEVTFVVTDSVGDWHNQPMSEGFPLLTVLLSRWESRQRHVRRIAGVLEKFDAVLLNHSAAAQSALGLLPDSTVALSILHNNVDDIYRVGLANLENLDAVVAVSERVREEAIARGGQANLVFGIRNGVQVFSGYPKATVSSNDGKPLRIIFLGRISHEQKGVFYLPGVMSCLRNLGVGFRLEIVGEGADREALKARFSDAGIPDFVHFHGAVPHDVAMRLLARCRRARDAFTLRRTAHYSFRGNGSRCHPGSFPASRDHG